ncbi:MAG TPA: 30S ribosomal protein S16 [Spirochaetota bacterium]|nr:30S ribosomal protein S16 [Spirochaetota bacterium]HOE19743.1 30S ribosomal protein S16 [Spirochaetota bacterium]HOT19030.1 30S ribosomal protein S16 [Spirochaetota bacterium]HQL42307.1 30S ribosomal protein S16 [Spirochaetota bacterium]
MVKIRLQRAGTKKKPFYKVVVIDSRKRRDGAVIESLGHYQPIVKGDQFVVDRDKVTEWLKKGAQPTETIAKLLNKAGITG